MITNVSNISQIQSIQQAAVQQKQQQNPPVAKQDRVELSAEAQELMKKAEADKAQQSNNTQPSQESQSTQAAQSGEAAQNAQQRTQPEDQDKKPSSGRDDLAQSDENPEDAPKNKTTAQLNIELTEEQKQMLTKLQARDKEVRAHEKAHVAAGGGLTGKPKYTEQRGPDGKMYAVGGTVDIDVSPAETPEKTIKKAQTIRAAALAPAEPSSEDRRIAAYADQMEAAARIEIEAAKKLKAEQKEGEPGFFEKIFSGVSFYA